MKGVMLEIPNQLLQQRRRNGSERWDEMWEGVLHMNPPPSFEHQDLEVELMVWLRNYWAKRGEREARHQAAVSPREDDWVEDYRTPDIILLCGQSIARKRETYLFGPPDAAIEICSPGDETYEKFPFHAQLKTPEIWVVHRDTKEIEVYVLQDYGYEEVAPDQNGWLSSAQTGIQLRATTGRKLEIRLADENDTKQVLPYE